MMKRSKILLMLLMGLILTLLPGCGKDEEDEMDEDFVLKIDWSSVNKAIEGYNFGTEFFLESDYKEDEADNNEITVYNYDDSAEEDDESLKYDLSITYGEIYVIEPSDASDSDADEEDDDDEMEEDDLYDKPMIQISMVENSEDERSYDAVFDTAGNLVVEDGEWFAAEDKDQFLSHVIEETQKMFGLNQ